MSLAAWKDLEQHYKSLVGVHMQELFLDNPNRFSQFSVQICDILLDYSKQSVTEESIEKLCQLAQASDLSRHTEALFSGERLNVTEQRSVLHTALRDFSNKPVVMNDRDIKPEIQSVLDKMSRLIEALQGNYPVGTQNKITDVISLGIGGSDLGPSMVCEALSQYKTSDLKLHFVSNVDGHTLNMVLKKCNPQSTVCIINSKTFTTPETLQNAKTLKTWFINAFEQHGKKRSGITEKEYATEKVKSHLIAVTANKERAVSFGVPEENILEFWDFVGGRYSVWSAVGLPIALQLGMTQFKAFLAGASEMDEHFRSAPFHKNMPVLLGVLGIWNSNFGGSATQAIIPYDDGLDLFPSYLQQLEMESNGKSINKEGKKVNASTCPVIWGGVGCNGQHAYMQLLHQGTQVIPVDFLIAAEGHVDFEEQHKILVASCLGQSKALMEGTKRHNNKNESRAKEGLDPLTAAKNCPGNRPSNTLMYPKLTPKVLGSLIALYEHKVFVQGIIWGINSFDQWGVELGKNLVKEIQPLLEDPALGSGMDSSTKGLMDFFHHCRKKT